MKPPLVTELDPVHPAVLNVTTAGRTYGRPHQRSDCGHKGCDKHVTIPLSDRRLKSFKKFRACAEQRGWRFDDKTDLFYCPDHHPNEEPMPTKTTPKITADTPPRQMDKEQRRAIFREIDESYDKNGYCSGITDQTIAAKLNIPWAWVSEVREENFGPAGPDPRIKKLAGQIEDAEKRAQTAYDTALAAAEKADNAVAEARSLKEQLVSLLGE